MSNASSLSADRTRRLEEVLAQYLEAVEAGQAPSRAELLTRHPDLAEEVQQFFANQKGLAALIHPAAPPAPPTRANTRVLPPVPTTQPLLRVNDYEILHEIARGGMGIVFRARQISLNREVALKMLLVTKGAESSTLRRFRLEAEAVAHLDHPNIVPIYEVGEIDGQAYFTMKLVEGGSLASRLADLRLPEPGGAARPSRAVLEQKLAHLVEIMAVVARAVHHAHQRGILHRDLKPGNILLDSEGRPLVSDFGLAKRLNHQGTNLTQPQAILGTATYMAPEQIGEKSGSLTTAVDVYSLGTILYELLTGSAPIVGESYFDTLWRVRHDPPVPPRQRNPNVPRDLELICLKCLSKDPAQRYGSALELAEDLERWRSGNAISLRPATTLERVRRWARRNRLAVALLGAVGGLMVAGTAGSLLAAWHIDAARDRADRNAEQAALLAEQEQAARAEAETARNQAETARNQAETARNQAVIARNQAENDRQQAVTANKEAERARAEAERARAEAERARTAARAGRRRKSPFARVWLCGQRHARPRQRRPVRRPVLVWRGAEPGQGRSEP